MIFEVKKYREAGIKDLEKLHHLGKLSYTEFSKDLTPENWKVLCDIIQNKDTIKNLIQIGKVFVCEIREEIVGMIYFIPSGNPTELYQENWCYIRFLGVDPKYRSLGIAKELVDSCLRYAKKSGEKIIALHTSEFMNSARIMYEKIGFIKTKEIKRLGRRYWVYKMKL